MKRIDLYDAALLKYGLQAQEDVLLEEMSELSKVILKGRRSRIIREDLVDEIADVEIMLEQIKQYHNLSNRVVERKRYKKRRLEERLKWLKKSKLK